MSGLLQKDLCLLKSNRKTLVLFLALAVVISLGQTNTFILGYFPFLMIIMLTGTISYDEMDNGFPFLFTLPVDRKMYIREKYLRLTPEGQAYGQKILPLVYEAEERAYRAVLQGAEGEFVEGFEAFAQALCREMTPPPGKTK